MLTPGRIRLLHALAVDVRIAKEEQAAALLTADGPVHDPVRELATLIAADMLRRDRVIARIPPPMAAPLARWAPGESPPDMAAVAWQSQKRWDVAPDVIKVYRAGPATRRLYGDLTAGTGNLSALAHDVACCELLLTFMRQFPERVPHWVGEDVRKDARAREEKLPDVILFDSGQNPYLVCEVVGVYPKARLEAFHDYVAGTLGLPYELW